MWLDKAFLQDFVTLLKIPNVETSQNLKAQTSTLDMLQYDKNLERCHFHGMKMLMCM